MAAVAGSFSRLDRAVEFRFCEGGSSRLPMTRLPLTIKRPGHREETRQEASVAELNRRELLQLSVAGSLLASAPEAPQVERQDGLQRKRTGYSRPCRLPARAETHPGLLGQHLH